MGTAIGSPWADHGRHEGGLGHYHRNGMRGCLVARQSAPLSRRFCAGLDIVRMCATFMVHRWDGTAKPCGDE
jgi:hypothetical protein